MLKKKRKICSEDGCDKIVHWAGFCRYHYATKQLAPKNNEKPPQRPQLAHRTKKRTAQEATYSTNRKTFIEAERDQHPQGKIFCIFCDKEIIGEPSLHHAFGRDADLILDEAFWFLTHHKCHMDYHSMSYNDIPWWNNYMFRIKNINPVVYQKELIRIEKA